MAIDEWMLEEQLSGKPPMLRLYGFAPPAITIGLSQKMDEKTINRIKARGFDVVRRPTGGRAVLHFKDITYSFVACQTGTGDYGILSHSVSNAYKQICTGLQEAFALMGLNVDFGSSEAAYRHLADCFLATTNADLQLDGKKLAGSAQLRRKGAVLQHGSIPLNLEQGLMLELLEGEQTNKQEKNPALARHANLFDLLSTELSTEDLSEKIKTGFELAFQRVFRSQPLTEPEITASRSFLPAQLQAN